MKKTLLLIQLALLAALSFSSQAWSAPEEFKHMKRNVPCAACHNSDAPTTPAKAKSCMQCHNYDALAAKSAEKIKNDPAMKGKLNPHDSHAGQLKCTECHKEHSKSSLYCLECHKNAEDARFKMDVP